MTAAERMRGWRLRQRLGLKRVAVDVDKDTLDRLMQKQLIEADDLGDRDRLAAALGFILDDAAFNSKNS